MADSKGNGDRQSTAAQKFDHKLDIALMEAGRVSLDLNRLAKVEANARLAQIVLNRPSPVAEEDS